MGQIKLGRIQEVQILYAHWQMAAGEIAIWDAELAADSLDRAVLARIEPAPKEIAPGLAILQTAGHTLGHASLIFTSAGLRVVPGTR